MYLSRHRTMSQTTRSGCFPEKSPRVIQLICFTTNLCLGDIQTHIADFTRNASLSQEPWILFWIWYKLMVWIINWRLLHLLICQWSKENDDTQHHEVFQDFWGAAVQLSDCKTQSLNSGHSKVGMLSTALGWISKLTVSSQTCATAWTQVIVMPNSPARFIGVKIVFLPYMWKIESKYSLKICGFLFSWHTRNQTENVVSNKCLLQTNFSYKFLGMTQICKTQISLAGNY